VAEVHSYGEDNRRLGLDMGQTQPLTQPSISIIYMCMFIYTNPLGFFLVNSVIEKIAEMKGSKYINHPSQVIFDVLYCRRFVFQRSVRFDVIISTFCKIRRSVRFDVL
jgi:hypothetical protein